MEMSPQTTKPAGYAWFVLFVLFLVYVLNFLDRQLLSILAKPIQDELGVSDGQLGMISGLYFAVFYCFISIPVGWLADRTNRTKVVALACGLWSAATVACGLSANYPQLVAARMSVGVGEAGGVPPSYAIISDYFASRSRGLAFGLFNLGPPVGQALGVAFGASIAAAYSWRYAFIVLGIVGIVMALVVFLTVREPKRGGLDKVTVAPTEKAGFWPTLRMFFSRPVLVLTALACGAVQFVTYASLNFTTLLLMREKDMALPDVAVWYALVVGLGMSASMIISGRLVDTFAPRAKSAYAWIPAIGLLCAIPPFIGFVHAPDWQTAILFLIGPMVFNYFYLSPAVALVQEAVAPHQRVMSGALLLLVMNLIGLGLGPTYLGAASDWLRAVSPDHSLQLAFYTLVPFYVLAAVLFMVLAGSLRKHGLTPTGEPS
ncbi:major Facilitator Superfamily protein [Asticcacaulis biprosthecium C19]|uniref:Major Facilitator Superfamily protein n=1 Tax=Asticcacaulis biprosthecium C19 TaxID=715226 RepID=F4QIT2_9CAUL|nr:MFS transporter [Asticcacaulis biprosthecium]EGF91841.1 major Facilitator Superfamily protein [Asticcacaulis biprosthecium C19]